MRSRSRSRSREDSRSVSPRPDRMVTIEEAADDDDNNSQTNMNNEAVGEVQKEEGKAERKRRHSSENSSPAARGRGRSKSRSRSRSRSAEKKSKRSRSRSRSPARRSRRSRSRSRSYSPRNRGGGGRDGGSDWSFDDHNREDGYRLHVADLDSKADKRDLEKLFGKYGPLKEIWMARSVPCFAFVVYRYREDAEESQRKVDGAEICGRRIRVTVARPRTRGRGRRGFDPGMRCYQCGERGHFSRDCPDTKWGYRRPPSPRRSRDDRRRDDRRF